MSSIGKVYGPPQGAKVLRIVAAAKVNGLDVDVQPTLPVEDSHKQWFIEKFPLGQVPAFEGSDGFKLTESLAILRYGTYDAQQQQDVELQLSLA
jgi:hypothetical protein